MPWTPEQQKAAEGIVGGIIGLFPTTGTPTATQAIGPTALIVIALVVVVLVMRK